MLNTVKKIEKPNLKPVYAKQKQLIMKDKNFTKKPK